MTATFAITLWEVNDKKWSPMLQQLYVSMCVKTWWYGDFYRHFYVLGGRILRLHLWLQHRSKEGWTTILLFFSKFSVVLGALYISWFFSRNNNNWRYVKNKLFSNSPSRNVSGTKVMQFSLKMSTDIYVYLKIWQRLSRYTFLKHF